MISLLATDQAPPDINSGQSNGASVQELTRLHYLRFTGFGYHSISDKNWASERLERAWVIDWIPALPPTFLFPSHPHLHHLSKAAFTIPALELSSASSITLYPLNSCSLIAYVVISTNHRHQAFLSSSAGTVLVAATFQLRGGDQRKSVIAHLIWTRRVELIWPPSRPSCSP